MSIGRPAPAGHGPVLDMHGVHFRYGSHEVLRDVGLSLDAGATCALVGPNGAGKSTLTKLVYGALSPLSGRVRVGGADPVREVSNRAAIAAVPQGNALYRRLTVRENVRAFSEIAGRPSGRSECDSALRLASAAGFADRRVDTLSGGQARLANIAVAMTGSPRLLILDEPTVGVDAKGQAMLTDTIEGLRRDGMAILLVSHDLDFAEATATHAALLVGGTMTMAGRLPSLVEDAFGRDAVEVTALLTADPEPAEREALAARGFQPTGGGRSWSTVYRGSERRTAPLDALLSCLPSLLELRTRAAGLPALMREATAGRQGSVS